MSTQAFAAVGYFRLEGEADLRTTLVTAKSRVAPLKPLTVPRLELQAAVTKDNVANEATRDTEHIEITSSFWWFTGPQFLVRGEDE